MNKESEIPKVPVGEAKTKTDAEFEAEIADRLDEGMMKADLEIDELKEKIGKLEADQDRKFYYDLSLELDEKCHDLKKELAAAKQELELKDKQIIGQYINLKNLGRQIEDLEKRIGKALKVFNEIAQRLPLPKKLSTYDSETKEDWLVETADPEEYRAFFNWIDENLAKWRNIAQPEKETKT